MNFHSRQLAFGAKVRKRRAHVPRQLHPVRIAEAYRARLQPLLDLMRDVVTRKLIPRLPKFAQEAEATRHDAASDTLDDLFEEMSDSLDNQVQSGSFVRIVQPVASQVSSFQREQLRGQLVAQTGVDPISREPWLEAKVDAFTKENVALIKSIPTEFFNDLEKKLARSIADGARAEDLAQDIADEFDVSENRASLIARDQVGKFFGELNEARQTELGIEQYVWRTAQDERVRDEHRVREGQTFQWDDPPEDGNPGEPVNCRCYGEPIIPELEDEEESQ